MKPSERVHATIEAAIEDAWAASFSEGRPVSADGLLVLHDLLIRAISEVRGVSMEDPAVEAGLDALGLPVSLRQGVYQVRHLMHQREERRAIEAKQKGEVH